MANALLDTSLHYPYSILTPKYPSAIASVPWPYTWAHRLEPGRIAQQAESAPHAWVSSSIERAVPHFSNHACWTSLRTWDAWRSLGNPMALCGTVECCSGTEGRTLGGSRGEPDAMHLLKNLWRQDWFCDANTSPHDRLLHSSRGSSAVSPFVMMSWSIIKYRKSEP